MIRVSVMYPNSGRFDFDYYNKKHMALVHQLLDPHGLVSTEVNQGLDANAPYIAVGHLIFDSLESMQEGLARHDARLAADLENYTDIRPQFQVSRIVTE